MKVISVIKYILMSVWLLMMVIVLLFGVVYVGVGGYLLITGNMPLQDEGILTKYVEDRDDVLIEFDGERQYTLDLTDGGEITYYGGKRQVMKQVFVGSYYYFYIWDKEPIQCGLSLKGLP